MGTTDRPTIDRLSHARCSALGPATSRTPPASRGRCTTRLADFRDDRRPGVRITFDRGAGSSLMSPSFRHEQVRISALVRSSWPGRESWACRGRLGRVPRRSARKDLDRGLEPDDCFYIAQLRGDGRRFGTLTWPSTLDRTWRSRWTRPTLDPERADLRPDRCAGMWRHDGGAGDRSPPATRPDVPKRPTSLSFPLVTPAD